MTLGPPLGVNGKWVLARFGMCLVWCTANNHVHHVHPNELLSVYCLQAPRAHLLMLEGLIPIHHSRLSLLS